MFEKYTREALSNAAASSLSFSDFLRALGINYDSGHLRRHLKRRLEQFRIPAPFLGRGRAWAKDRVSTKRLSPDEILVHSEKGRRGETQQLRRALLEIGVEHKCAICAVGTEWRGAPLVLQIDHLDGDRTNHRRGNLRFLCPNCHSQTPTYGKTAGRSSCEGCGIPLRRPSRKCRSCASRDSAMKQPTKATWPTDELLARQVWETPVQRLAATLGVSESAVKKRCRLRGIATPPRGYWAKRGYSSKAECVLAKHEVRVQFSLPAPHPSDAAP